MTSFSYVITDQPQLHYSYEDNAQRVYEYLTELGFANGAAIGIIANMEHESYLNPGQTELFQNGNENYGYGLVQWTPAKDKILNYDRENWFEGEVQLNYLMISTPSSWIPTSEYPVTWVEYMSIDDAEYATRVFFACFERGTWHDDLLEYANHYSEIIDDESILEVLIAVKVLK